MITKITNSAGQTQQIARNFLASQGEALQGNRSEQALVIALFGELGSGKTTFAQGLAKGLGITKRLISPTFIIVRTYSIQIKNKSIRQAQDKKSKIKDTNKNKKTFYHIDLYRIDSEEDLQGLGIQDIINDPQNIVAIEWAERLGKLLPKERIDIHFRYIDEKEREITIYKNE